MPSFPASVKAFTTKLDGAGNPINSAHVNDLQDEVNAIEAGYLNATARLNSSASTLASLSVTGNSTVAALTGGATTLASLQVTGASSFATKPLFAPPDMALVYRETVYELGSSVSATLAFNQQAIAINSSMHSTTTNPSQLTPQSTGVYQISAMFETSLPTAAAQPVLTIVDSSGGEIAHDENPAATTRVRCNVTAYKRFDVVGGNASVRFANNAAASTLSLSSGVGRTWFAMVRL